jgi:hypothetical protein
MLMLNPGSNAMLTDIVVLASVIGAFVIFGVTLSIGDLYASHK